MLRKDTTPPGVYQDVEDTSEYTTNLSQSFSQYLETNNQEENINEHNNPSNQDNIMESEKNKNGRKLMSEESEAFFWDWILQNE